MKNLSGTATDCPLCRGEEVRPEYTVNNLFQSDTIGLRSRITWRLSGTTLLQTVEASYTSDFAAHYDEDCTPELNYTVPIHGLSHCPCCRRRLVESIEENDGMEITRPANDETTTRKAPPNPPNVPKIWGAVIESNFKQGKS